MCVIESRFYLPYFPIQSVALDIEIATVFSTLFSVSGPNTDAANRLHSLYTSFSSG